MTPVSRLAFRLIGIPHLGFRGRARHILREALRLTGPDTKVLDAGCGYGLYSIALSKRGLGRIDSIDIDPDRIAALERMKAEKPAEMSRMAPRIGSVTALPFADDFYDLINCSEVVEHVAEDAVALKELARVLKPNGRLILSVPYPSKHNQKIYRRFGHERPGYTKQDLASMLEPLGLNIEKDFYYEYSLGTMLFEAFNAISWKPLMGILFYPFYALYRLDALLRIGEPNGIVIVARKSAS